MFSSKTALPSVSDSPTMLAVDHLLAHQGGWDEIALVAGPIVILGALLWLANRRADRIAAEREDSNSN